MGLWPQRFGESFDVTGRNLKEEMVVIFDNIGPS